MNVFLFVSIYHDKTLKRNVECLKWTSEIKCHHFFFPYKHDWYFLRYWDVQLSSNPSLTDAILSAREFKWVSDFTALWKTHIAFRGYSCKSNSSTNHCWVREGGRYWNESGVCMWIRSLFWGETSSLWAVVTACVILACTGSRFLEGMGRWRDSSGRRLMAFPWGEHSQGNPYRTETESFKLGQAERMGSQIQMGREGGWREKVEFL